MGLSQGLVEAFSGLRSDRLVLVLHPPQRLSRNRDVRDLLRKPLHGLSGSRHTGGQQWAERPIDLWRLASKALIRGELGRKGSLHDGIRQSVGSGRPFTTVSLPRQVF
jgi:hypothetical protein